MNTKEANSTGNCVGGDKKCEFFSDNEQTATNEAESVQNAKNYINNLKSQNNNVYTTQHINNIYKTEQKNKVNDLISKMNLKEKDNRIGKLNVDLKIDMDESAEELRMKEVSGQKVEGFIGEDMRFMDPASPDKVNNASPKDYTYNSYADYRAPTFNQWTRIHDDSCNYENRLKLGTKPMKYYVNQFNSPQVDPFMEYTVIGNQKSYEVRNEFERPIPTRLNPIYPTHIEPYPTTPFLGSANSSREFSNTSSNLRFGNDVRAKKSQAGLSEKDFNRYDPGVYSQTVQNANQFVPPGGRLQQPIGDDGYYNYASQNNTIVANGAWERAGISSRDLLHNLIQIAKC